MRQAFFETLLALRAKNKNIVLLTGDLGFTVFEPFEKRYPMSFINVGAAEQNLMSIAAGIALTGKTVFAYSIATFATMRPFEQIKIDIASHNASVVIVGTGAGLSYSEASITHHATEDIALMSCIPNMTVLCPGDPLEAIWATRVAAKLHKPVYLRLGKKGEPEIPIGSSPLTLGKGHMLEKGKTIAILATGNLVHTALMTSKVLKNSSLSPTVVSMHTIKPLDRSLIIRLAKTHRYIVTIEEHNIIGGLGNLVAEVIASEALPVRLLRFGIPDTFVFDIGSHDYLRHILHLTPEHIAAVIRRKTKS